jgi:hypothetical protein
MVDLPSFLMGMLIGAFISIILEEELRVKTANKRAESMLMNKIKSGFIIMDKKKR